MEDHTVSQSRPVLAPSGQTSAEPAAASTPGPWRVEAINGHKLGIRVEGRAVSGFTAFIETDWPFADQRDELRANACLIAAAPDLLAALRDACECIRELSDYANRHGGMLDDEEFAPGLAAIAKATGAQTPDRSAS